jgi:hypothetical protein
MRRMFLLLILVSLPGFAAADNIWITRSLKAGLIIQPITNPEPDGPSFRVLLELNNLGVESSNGNLADELKLQCGPMNLKLHVTDETGRELAKSMRPVDQMMVSHTIVLPPEGVLTFPIGRGGETPYKFSSGGPGKLLSFGPTSEWIIPQADGHTYYLSGVLKVGSEQGSQSRDWNRSTIDWTGTDDLGRVEIPQG